jgi:hypothetical protein
MRFLLFIVLLLSLTGCNRPSGSYFARLTEPEVNTVFSPKESISKLPRNPKNGLFTVEINLTSNRVSLFYDLEKTKEAKGFYISQTTTPFSLTIGSPDLNKKVVFEIPDRETLRTNGDIEFKQ